MPPPVAVSVAVPPIHNGFGLAVALTDRVPTSTVAQAEAVQPLSVTVTQYVVVAVGDTEIFSVVAPLSH